MKYILLNLILPVLIVFSVSKIKADNVSADSIVKVDSFYIQFFCDYPGKYQIYWGKIQIFNGKASRSKVVDTIILKVPITNNFLDSYKNNILPLHMYRKQFIVGFTNLELELVYHGENNYLVLSPYYKFRKKYLIQGEWQNYPMRLID